MGGIHGKTSSKKATTTIDKTANASNVIDGGVGSTISMNQITGAEAVNLNLSDHDAIEKAFDFGMESLGASGATVESAFDYIESSAQRNYDFAERVSIPLSGQITEQFTKYVIGASVLVAVSLVYLQKKKRSK